MKILHALGWYFPESLGGTEVYVAGLAARQAMESHDVTVAAPKPGLGAAEPGEHNGVPLFRYPIPAAPTRDEAQGRSVARGAEHLHAYLAETRPDVFHVHTFTTGLGVYELEAARELGIRVIATNHLASIGYLCQRGTLMRWGEFPCDGVVFPVKCAACQLQERGLSKAGAYAVAGLARASGGALALLPGRAGTAFGMTSLIRHNRELQRRMLAAVERFVLLNRAARDIALANGADPSKLALNYLGLSHPPSPKPPPDARPTERPVTLGYLGRFVAIKGVLDLARAVASLPRDLDFRLEVRAPMNDEARRVRAQFDAIVGGDRRVELAPAVGPDEVPDVLSRFDVLCVPSRWFENGPTVVSESFGAGTPVIGTRMGAMPELIVDGESGALVDPGDWQALAQVLAEVAAHPETVDRWRRALPKARTMDAIAEDYERLYRGE